MKPTEQYIEKASALTEDVANQLLAKGQIRFSSDPDYRRLLPHEKVAVQLQHEDAAQHEWMTKVVKLRQLSSGAC